jgi:hypothetical protein
VRTPETARKLLALSGDEAVACASCREQRLVTG